jgi:hypothetical protein
MKREELRYELLNSPGISAEQVVINSEARSPRILELNSRPSKKNKESGKLTFMAVLSE